MPFHELERVETPMTFYAATKKANESMAHSYAHLWNIPTTMFRFFIVYGPWGRPDMALFKFVRGILEETRLIFTITAKCIVTSLMSPILCTEFAD